MLYDPELALKRGADYLKQHGWSNRSTAHDPHGRVCIVAAVNNANMEVTESVKRDAFELLYRSLKKWPFVWNDTVCKTEEQAVAALRGAARVALKADK